MRQKWLRPLWVMLALAGVACGNEHRDAAVDEGNRDRESSSESADHAVHNPVIWADVPDPSVIRVDDVYYMSSTTMHMNPGVPIMKSRDLVNWELSGYVYDTLADGEQERLQGGKDVYGQGSWASSLRYHDGTYYVTTFANSTGKTYVFSTDDIEKGPWKRETIDELFHDASLVFDQGRVFLVYGAGEIRLVELTGDASSVKEGGVHRTLIDDASSVAGSEFIVPAEGAQVQTVDGQYYINLITWPEGGVRTQLLYRSDNLFGPYEGRVVLEDEGVAQGGLVDTPEGEWFAFLFQDHGAVGRTPYLVPVSWEGDWPEYGVDGEAPQTLDREVGQQTLGNLVHSDEFDNTDRDALALAWQWNHNPSGDGWSLSQRPGHLSLTNTEVDEDLVSTRDTLTQRTFGPESTATTVVDHTRMRAGDYAGLAALQARYGFVGVEKSEEGASVVMVKGEDDNHEVIERVPLAGENVHLRIEMDFRDREDRARFFYSDNGSDWQSLGEPLNMEYTLPHFMGYRFGLFSYATRQTGGRADFDFYRVSGE